MADNYLQFSFVVDNLTPAEHAAFKAKLEWAERVVNNDGLEGEDVGDENLALQLSGLRWRLTDTSVWFYSEEAADPAVAADLVSDALLTANSSRVVGFAWAETCSKPRLDEFGGGAVAISKDRVEFFGLYEWLREQLEKMAGGK